MKSAGLRVPQQWDEIRILRRTPSGRAQTLTFGNEHSENDVPVAASSLRFAVGRSMGWSFLKSDLYDVASNGDHFVFTGRGTGHGVGLCQFGAAEMAREGKSYRDILAFYYPGASIGVAASGIVWRKSPSARLDVFTVDGEPRSALQSGVRALTWAESQTRLHSTIRPAIYVYPSVEMFRNATGEPGWVAASTRDQTIRMQPAKVLGAKMESILRHEFVHVLLENHAAPQTPLWFREGLAMLMTGDVPTSATPLGVRQMEETLRTRSDNKSIQAAYASALTLTARLEQRYGRDEILRWLTNGIPSGIVEGQSRLQETAHHR
jgi:stage II sporulation protein D